MPTAQDYANAAIRLDALSDELDVAVTPSRSQLEPAALTGGLFGAQVQELVTRRDRDATAHAGGLIEMADQCRQRAALAAALDAAWGAYDQAFDAHVRNVDQWEAARDDYVADPFEVEHPGNAPTAPSPPAEVPDWYERT